MVFRSCLPASYQHLAPSSIRKHHPGFYLPLYPQSKLTQPTCLFTVTSYYTCAKKKEENQHIRYNQHPHTRSSLHTTPHLSAGFSDYLSHVARTLLLFSSQVFFFVFSTSPGYPTLIFPSLPLSLFVCLFVCFLARKNDNIYDVNGYEIFHFFVFLFSFVLGCSEYEGNCRRKEMKGVA